MHGAASWCGSAAGRVGRRLTWRASKASELDSIHKAPRIGSSPSGCPSQTSCGSTYPMDLSDGSERPAASRLGSRPLAKRLPRAPLIGPLWTTGARPAGLSASGRLWSHERLRPGPPQAGTGAVASPVLYDYAVGCTSTLARAGFPRKWDGESSVPHGPALSGNPNRTGPTRAPRLTRGVPDRRFFYGDDHSAGRVRAVDVSGCSGPSSRALSAASSSSRGMTLPVSATQRCENRVTCRCKSQVQVSSFWSQVRCPFAVEGRPCTIRGRTGCGSAPEALPSGLVPAWPGGQGTIRRLLVVLGGLFRHRHDRPGRRCQLGYCLTATRRRRAPLLLAGSEAEGGQVGRVHPPAVAAP